MNFDVKNSLLKSSVGEQRLGKKNINTTIDESMVASTEKKSLEMEMKDHEGNPLDPKNKNKKKKQKEKVLVDETKKQKTEVKIERDPLKLLKLF